jgi:hypothetical protein
MMDGVHTFAQRFLRRVHINRFKGTTAKSPMSHYLVLMVTCMEFLLIFIVLHLLRAGLDSGGLVANFFLHLPPSLARTIGLGHETVFKFLIKMNSSRSK